MVPFARVRASSTDVDLSLTPLDAPDNSEADTTEERERTPPANQRQRRGAAPALGGALLTVTRNSYVARNGTVHACVAPSGAVRFAQGRTVMWWTLLARGVESEGRARAPRLAGPSGDPGAQRSERF